MKKYLKLMRVHHWIKNFLVLLPVIFNRSFFHVKHLEEVGWGFVSISFIASVVYIFNDIKDCEKDKLHPTKKNRPIASGAVTVPQAKVLGILLFIIAIGINGYFLSWDGIFLLLLYFGLNVGYSNGLKNVPIADITILVSGFLIRVFYGASITGIQVSGWLYLTIIAVSFYFGLGKRRNEIMATGTGETRKVLQYYTKDFLDKNMYLCLALGIVFYALWTIENPNNVMVWTVPIVMVICMKYNLDLEKGYDGDPVEVLFKDKVLIGLSMMYAIVVLGLLYLV